MTIDSANEQTESLYWTFLVVRMKYGKEKVNTDIFHGTNPIEKCEKKSIKSKRKHYSPWFVELIVGPFKDKQTAKSVKSNWKKDTRGLNSRKLRGFNIAKDMNLETFDAAVDRVNRKTKKVRAK
jgi:hypothetical protein